MTKSTWPDRAFTIFNETTEPFCVTVNGRDRWALESLMEAQERGCTPYHNPAPRWAAYVKKLRKARIRIETVTEKHGGAFPGHHARYVLRSRVIPGRAV